MLLAVTEKQTLQHMDIQIYYLIKLKYISMEDSLRFEKIATFCTFLAETLFGIAFSCIDFRTKMSVISTPFLVVHPTELFKTFIQDD